MTEEQLKEAFRATNTEEPLCGGWPGLLRFGLAVAAAERELCAKLVSDVGDDWEAVCDMQKVAACDYLEDAIRSCAVPDTADRGMMKKALEREIVTMRGLASCQGDGDRIDEAEKELADLRAEIQRLKDDVGRAKRKAFVTSRICYRGFSYGMGSQDGIDSLRSAISSNGHG